MAKEDQKDKIKVRQQGGIDAPSSHCFMKAQTQQADLPNLEQATTIDQIGTQLEQLDLFASQAHPEFEDPENEPKHELSKEEIT